MNQVLEIKRINERELKEGISASASWHAEYGGSAWVFVGNLPMDIRERDIENLFDKCVPRPFWTRLARPAPPP